MKNSKKDSKEHYNENRDHKEHKKKGCNCGKNDCHECNHKEPKCNCKQSGCNECNFFKNCDI